MDKNLKNLGDAIKDINDWAKEANANGEKYPDKVLDDALAKLEEMEEGLAAKLKETEATKEAQ